VCDDEADMEIWGYTECGKKKQLLLSVFSSSHTLYLKKMKETKNILRGGRFDYFSHRKNIKMDFASWHSSLRQSPPVNVQSTYELPLPRDVPLFLIQTQ